MDVFDLVAKLKLDSSGYEEGLQNAETKGLTFGSGLKKAATVGAAAVAAVGTAAIAAGTALAKGVGDVAAYGDNIDKMSQKMGISAQAYQEWDFVMQHCGTSIEALKPSMKTLAIAAEKGSDAFDQLGISQEQIASMSQEELFNATIAGLQNVTDETQRTALAAELLGRGATELGPIMNMTAEDTEAMRQQVHDLGGVMSDDAVKAAAAYKDSLQNLQTSISGLKNKLTGDLLPSVTTVMDGLTMIFSGGDTDEAMEMIGQGIDELAAKLEEIVPKVLEIGGSIILKLAEAIIENLPTLIDTGMNVLNQLIEGIIEALPQLLQAGMQIITGLVDAILRNLPTLVQVALQMLLTLEQGIVDQLPTLIPAIIDVVLQVVQTLIDNLPMLIEGAIQLFLGIVTGLIQALPQIIAALPTLIDSIINALIDSIPLLVDCGVQLFLALIENLPEIIAALVQAVPEIIAAIIEAFAPIVGDFGEVFSEAWGKIKEVFANVGGWFKEKFSDAKEKAYEAFSGIKDYMSQSWEDTKQVYSVVGDWFKEKFENAKENTINAWSNIREKMSEIWDRIKSAFNFSDAANWGRDMIDNFIGGVREKWEALKGTVSNVAQTVRNFLGFSEPEVGPLSDFHTYAPDMMKLFAQGIDQNLPLVEDSLNRMGNMVRGNMQFSTEGVNRGATYNGGITINVYGAEGQNVRELAREIEKIFTLQDNQRRAAYA